MILIIIQTCCRTCDRISCRGCTAYIRERSASISAYLPLVSEPGATGYYGKVCIASFTNCCCNRLRGNRWWHRSYSERQSTVLRDRSCHTRYRYIISARGQCICIVKCNRSAVTGGKGGRA